MSEKRNPKFVSALRFYRSVEILEKEFKVAANIWSVTSFNELRKDMESVERENRLKASEKPALSYVAQCLKDHAAPVIAATDYIKMNANQIREAVAAPYYVLGTDGFGRSDTRAALRDFFEVDAKMVVYTALFALMEKGDITKKELVAARKKLEIGADRVEPIKK